MNSTYPLTNKTKQCSIPNSRRLQTRFQEPGILQPSLYVLQEFGPTLVPPVFYWTANSEYSWSVIKFCLKTCHMYSSNTGSHYSFLCYSAIINILFFNFSSLYQLSKYFRQSQLFNFYIMSYLKLEFRLIVWIISSRRTCFHIWLSLSPKDSLFLSLSVT